MAEARGRDAWNHTSVLLATIININRPKGKSPVKAESLNPYIYQKQNKVVMINREEALDVFQQIAGNKGK